MKTNNQEHDTIEEMKVKSIDYILIKRLLTYVQSYRIWVILAIGLLIISAAIETWVPIRIGQIAQTIVGHQEESDTEKSQIFYAAVAGCGILLLWILLNYVLDVLNILIKNWIGQKAIFTMRTQVYEHIQQLPMSFYDHQAIGRLMTRTIHDVDQINQLLSESVIPLIGSFILFIGIFIGIFFLNWKMGILFCFIFPMIWGLVQHFRHQQQISYNSVRSILSKMNAFIQEHLMGVHIIRHFGLYSSERKKFEEMNYDYYKANLDTVKHFSFFFTGTEFLRNLTMISVFLLLAYISPDEFGLHAGAYFTISIYCFMIFRPLLDLAERYNVLQAAMAAAERIFKVLDTPIESKGACPGLVLNEVETIEFQNVWFAYENENWILKGLTFSLNKGESLAIVGVTGSGKTTIMNLLLVLYDFQKGRILINGQDIHQYSIASIRNQFSVILQDPTIFSGTIRDNITLYDPTINIEQVEMSAKYVNLKPIIDRFPSRYDHILTERGSSLSVGEMQLIALARAVAHKRSILVLDEATSNIDIHTEHLIQETIKKMLGQQTALVIAHRLSTIKDVNRILVLNQGVVVESGTHQQLLDAHGIYEKLYRLQFSAMN
ncbi:MAG: ABC transporter ATP-binding protein [Parachlamydiaceae bacterium]|nr:ABC transporter ATP-binding protein [Parachlamydiaceae bacterium]